MDLRAVVALLALAGCGGREAPWAARLDGRVVAGGAPAGVVARDTPSPGAVPGAAEGERTFVAMNCDGCHGGGAAGWVGPSLRDGRWRYGGSDDAIFESIAFGRPRGMPAYGSLLSPAAIRKITAYLRSLAPPPNVPTQSWR